MSRNPTEIPLALVGSLRLLDPPRRRRVLVAYLHRQGLSQKEIKAVLATLPDPITVSSGATVSEDIQQALDEEWIKITLSPQLHPDLIAEVRNILHRERWQKLEKDLKNKAGGRLKTLRVFYSGATRPAVKPHGKNSKLSFWIRRFARNAAWFIEKELEKAKMVGVAGGSTVAEVVDALLSLPPDNRRRNITDERIRVIPVSCDPPAESPEDIRIPSSHVAIELCRFLNGSPGHVPSLANIPPAMRNKGLLDDFVGWSEIFGSGAKSLINKVDTILTSAGAFHAWTTIGVSYSKLKITSADLKSVSDGDIALAPIPKLSLSPQMKDKFEELAAMLTGIRYEQVKVVADAAARGGQPGVLLVALGDNKADVIFDLVTRIQSVNVLVIDETLAQALMDRV